MSFRDDLDRQRAQIMRAVRQAGTDWAEAMRAHKLAPPDAGFAARLRALSEAAASEQVAWEHAHAAGLMWRPIPGAESARAAVRASRGNRTARAPGVVGAVRRDGRGAQPRDHRIERRRTWPTRSASLRMRPARSPPRSPARTTRSHGPRPRRRVNGRPRFSYAIKTRYLRGPKVEIPQCGRTRRRRNPVPQIIVTADRGAAFEAGAVTHRERVSLPTLRASISRVSWSSGSGGP